MVQRAIAILRGGPLDKEMVSVPLDESGQPPKLSALSVGVKSMDFDGSDEYYPAQKVAIPESDEAEYQWLLDKAFEGHNIVAAYNYDYGVAQ